MFDEFPISKNNFPELIFWIGAFVVPLIPFYMDVDMKDALFVGLLTFIVLVGIKAILSLFIDSGEYDE